MFNKRMKNFFLPAVMLILFLMGTSFAQVEDARPQDDNMNRQNAERWTQTLNNRLTLTEDQQTRINSILMDYQTRRNQLGTTSDPTTLQNDVNRQIEGVLDDNQRTNWDTYSTTWWNEINRGTGNDMQFERRNQDMEHPSDTDTDRNRDVEIEREETEIRTDDDDIR
jgi:hypothetical protein